ncbi:MAG: MSHA biogenesis protein MshP [Gammaproteobacteria bacterium]|nr:MAG: MSHA biogenesis protein MshP [Gammaproteobacteria bacterium]
MRRTQQGFLMPLAIFIVVVMGIFALVLSRNTGQSSAAAALELVSSQAFYAAETGAQRGMQNLFYPDARVRQQVDQRCANLTSTPLVIAFKSLANPGLPDVRGLNNCSITVTCVCRFADDTNCSPITATNYAATAAAGRITSNYQITSVGTCGIGHLRSVRTVEVGSYLKQE